MGRAIAWWVVLAGLWLALIDNHHLDELTAGLFATVVGSPVAVVASDRLSPGACVPGATLLVLPRVAWPMTLDTGLLLRALWQTVVLRRPARGAGRRGGAAGGGRRRGAGARRDGRRDAPSGADASRPGACGRGLARDARVPAFPAGGARAMREIVAGILLFCGVGLELAAAL